MFRRLFGGVSDLIAKVVDLPVEDAKKAFKIVLHWCQKTTGKLSEKCITNHSMWIKTFSERERKH
jgi:hypothetical protein